MSVNIVMILKVLRAMYFIGPVENSNYFHFRYFYLEQGTQSNLECYKYGVSVLTGRQGCKIMTSTLMLIPKVGIQMISS